MEKAGVIGAHLRNDAAQFAQEVDNAGLKDAGVAGRLVGTAVSSTRCVH